MPKRGRRVFQPPGRGRLRGRGGGGEGRRAREGHLPCTVGRSSVGGPGRPATWLTFRPASALPRAGGREGAPFHRDGRRV